MGRGETRSDSGWQLSSPWPSSVFSAPLRHFCETLLQCRIQLWGPQRQKGVELLD